MNLVYTSYCKTYQLKIKEYTVNQIKFLWLLYHFICYVFWPFVAIITYIKWQYTCRKGNCKSNFQWQWQSKILFFTVEKRSLKVKVLIFLIWALLRHIERLYVQYNPAICLLYFSYSITEIILPQHVLSSYLPNNGHKRPKHVACNILQ